MTRVYSPTSLSIAVRTAYPSFGEWAGLTPNKFVTANATGGGSGAQVNPWTAAQAFTNAQPGDTVGFYPGVYVGVNPKPEYDARNDQIRMYAAFEPANNGTASQPITFVAQYPAAHHSNQSQYTELRTGSDGKDPETGGVFVWGYGDEAHESEYGWPVLGSNWWGGGDYVNYIGFYINGAAENNSIYDDTGYINIRGSHHTTVTQCKVYGDLNRVYIGNNYSAVRIEEGDYSTITDNEFAYFGTNEGNATSVLYYTSPHFVFSHNWVHDMSMGVFPKAGRTDDLWGDITHNKFERTQRCIQPTGLRQWVYDGSQAQIKHNLVVDCRDFIYLTTSDGKTYMNYINVENNTVIRADQYRGLIFFAWVNSATLRSKTSSVRNNIAVDSKAVMCSDNGGVDLDEMSLWADFNYNCWHNMPLAVDGAGSTDMTYAQWEAAYGHGADSIYVDPQFVDPDNGDYRLQAGSPCRGTGQGSVNMGCYITGNELIGIRS